MLRSELWYAINQAFSLCKVQYRLHGVSQKKSRVSLAQDLNDLACLSSIFREQFKTVHFNFALSEKAAHVVRELDEKIAALRSNGMCFGASICHYDIHPYMDSSKR
jgi:hypothetical protein